MQELKWGPELEVNVRELDLQHRRMFDIIGRLESCLTDGCGREQVVRHLAELEALTEENFLAEDRLMAEHDFPDRGKHSRDVHTHLLRELLQLRWGYGARTREMDAKSVAFLRRWLVSHILYGDKALGSYLNQRGVY